MNFTAYIERQKNLIRVRNAGAVYFISDKKSVAVRATEEIFDELDSLEGLNTSQRGAFCGVRRSTAVG